MKNEFYLYNRKDNPDFIHSFPFLGNAGGYIGMFLGWSLLSLPGMFQMAIYKVKEMMCPKKTFKQDIEGSY